MIQNFILMVIVGNLKTPFKITEKHFPGAEHKNKNSFKNALQK